MGTAGFICVLQVAVIGKIKDKKWRLPLMAVTIIFQMAVLAIGIFIDATGGQG